jgi:hypothetical protein
MGSALMQIFLAGTGEAKFSILDFSSVQFSAYTKPEVVGAALSYSHLISTFTSGALLFLKFGGVSNLSTSTIESIPEVEQDDELVPLSDGSDSPRRIFAGGVGGSFSEIGGALSTVGVSVDVKVVVVVDELPVRGDVCVADGRSMGLKRPKLSSVKPALPRAA